MPNDPVRFNDYNGADEYLIIEDELPGNEYVAFLTIGYGGDEITFSPTKEQAERLIEELQRRIPKPPKESAHIYPIESCPLDENGQFVCPSVCWGCE